MTKKDAKQEVLDLIDKKVKRRKSIRKSTRPEATYAQEVLKFLNNLDILSVEAEDELDFLVAMDRECKLLQGRLRSFDPYIEALVEWNDTMDWTKLEPLGVKIKWSKHYMILHPESEQEEYIDIGRLLLDDYD